MKPQCVTIQMKATEQYFHVALFIMLYKVALTFKSVDETLVCDHSNESYLAVLSFGTDYHAVYAKNTRVFSSTQRGLQDRLEAERRQPLRLPLAPRVC